NGAENDGEDDISDDLIGLLVVVPVYIIIFVIITPMSLILISVTIEREQKTLETLFLQPVKRRDIVLGKVYYGMALVLITIFLDMLALVLAVIIFTSFGDHEMSDILDLMDEAYQELGLQVILGFLVALLVIAVNIIAFAILLSLVAKDEREANMISGILPMLIFGIVAFIFIVPVDEFNTVYQAIWVSLPVIGVIIVIYLSGLAGSIIWLAYLSVVAQIIWAYFTISFITKISEAESIIELSYGAVFKELKRIILRRK
ncbi:MAG: ABC transporter permease subunit, partial [Candidatus Kariarchaeaceae archaeon]